MNKKYNDAAKNFLENYHDILNNFPLDAQREVSRYREIDCRYSNSMNKLFNYIEKTENLETNDERFQKIMNEVSDLSIRKHEIVECLSDMVGTKVHTLKMSAEKVAKLPLIDSNKEKSKLMPDNNNIDSDSIDVQNTNSSNKRPKRNVTELSTTLNKSLVMNAHSDGKSSTNQNKVKNTSNKKSNVKPAKIRKLVSGSESCDGDVRGDDLEPTYCICEQKSYGDMIACDNYLCPLEWCHFECVSVSGKPKGKWYCPFCRGTNSKTMKPKKVFLKKLEKYNKHKEENN